MQYPYLKRLPAFEYLAPKTLDEALQMLRQHNGQARLLAGGTDLILNMKRRRESPAYLIGLKNIPGLDYLKYAEGEGLRLGALVKVHDVETSALIKEKFPVLAQAAAALGSVQVRNLATVAGNLCSALPSADMAPGLIVLDARLKIAGLSGERVLQVEKFFLGPGKPALEPGEMVVEIQVPEPPPKSRAVYLKHTQRSAMDLAIVGVAAFAAVENSICLEARICLGTVGPTPLRAFQAEAVLRGRTLDSGAIEEAAAAASRECSPRSSMRSSAEYRREMVKVLTARAFKEIKKKL